jgi:acyl carrier protein
MFVMILEKVKEVIVKTVHCKSEDVTLEAELMSLGVDSLKALSVLFELEEVFDIEIPNELIPSIVTVNDIVERLHAANQPITS